MTLETIATLSDAAAVSLTSQAKPPESVMRPQPLKPLRGDTIDPSRMLERDIVSRVAAWR